MATRSPMQTYTCGYCGEQGHSRRTCLIRIHRHLRAPEETYRAGIEQRDKEMRQALSWYLHSKRQAAEKALETATSPLEQAMAQGRLNLANEMLEDARKLDEEGVFK